MSAPHKAAKRKQRTKLEAEAAQAEAAIVKPFAATGAQQTTIYHWTVLGTDETGKRIAVRCRCGALRLLAASSLKDGTVAKSCGCINRYDPAI